MTPDISDHAQDIPALGALSKCIGNHILVTHSAGGVTGWLSAMQNVEVKAVVAYEPGGFVFPEGEVPERIDGLTDGADGIPVPINQFKRLTEIPIVLYFGDYIPETPAENLGDENWRVRFQMARKFAETINRHGGNATLVGFPAIGSYGHTHSLMQDLNNDELAGLLDYLIYLHSDNQFVRCYLRRCRIGFRCICDGLSVRTGGQCKKENSGRKSGGYETADTAALSSIHVPSPVGYGTISPTSKRRFFIYTYCITCRGRVGIFRYALIPFSPAVRQSGQDTRPSRVRATGVYRA